MLVSPKIDPWNGESSTGHTVELLADQHRAPHPAHAWGWGPQWNAAWWRSSLVFFSPNSMEILWKSYGNSMEIYESRRVPWHFHRFPYVFQTLRENMWECHGLFLLSKSREKRGGSEATNMLGRHQKLWHWWSWDAMSPRMQLWKVSGSHGVSPSYWLLPPNYVALSIPKNKNSKARWSNSMCSTFVHEIEQVE